MKKFVPLAYVVFISSSVFSQDLNKKIENFWRFVSQNENVIFNAPDTDAKIHSDIYERIQLIDSNIFVMLSRLANNKRDLIVTANGNTDYFSLCDKIVNAAPRLHRINPISLFPKTEVTEPFVYGSIALGPDEVRVHFEGGKAISLLFVLPNEHLSRINSDKSGQAYNIYMQILYMMTQQILGERLMAEKIISGDISPLSSIVPSVPITGLYDKIK